MEFDSLKKKLVSGSLAGFARVALAIPAYLITTPFVLHHLGAELFGLWSLTTLVMSVMVLTDFGFKNALVFRVAGNLGNHRLISEHFNVTLLSYLILASTVLALTAIFGDRFAQSILNIQPIHGSQAYFVLVATAVGFGLRFLSLPLQAVEEGHQEHATVQSILLLWLAIQFGGTLIALSLRPDIYALGIASIVPNAVVLVVFLWRRARRYKEITIGLHHLKISAFKEMIRYGSGIQAAAVLIAAREPIYKILITRTSDLATLATFEIVYKLCTQLVSLVIAPLSGSFSASALLAESKTDELGRIIRPMFGFGLAMFVPAVIFTASFATILVNLWLGPGFPNVAPMLVIAFAAFSVYYCSEVLYKAIEGSGLSGYSSVIQLLTFSISIGSFILMAGDTNTATALSLLFGFSVFSVVNFAVFRWRFPTIALCDWTQWLWLLFPAAVFLVAIARIDEVFAPLLFLVYAMIHVYGCRRSQLFDFVGMGRKIARVVRSVP